MQLGVNVDPRHGFRAEDIAAPGVTWVRTVLMPPPDDLMPWLDGCDAHGLKVLGVVARESLKRGWTYKTAARYYAQKYGARLAATQVGNESDLRSPSSWTMRPERLNRLLRAFRVALPGATIIGPGLASGQPGYWSQVETTELELGIVEKALGIGAIAIHTYGQRPSSDFPSHTWGFGEVQTLIDLYRQHTTLPIWVTEWGGPERDFTDEHERARYHSEMLLALRDAGVEVAIQFCWSDAMVDGFGLVDAQGVAKESYASFFDGAQAMAGKPTLPLGEGWGEGVDTPLLDLRGALPATGHYAKRDLERIDSAIIHYTATPPTLPVATIAKAQLGRDAAPGGPKFPAIAYHLVIEGDGQVYWCHDLDRRTWGSAGAGWNERAVHICYVGDHEPNPAQLAGIRSAIDWCQAQLGRSLAIEGHKDVVATGCPGPTWPAWRKTVLP